jgi:hypothetical protein|tara:strand:- start:868 stop:1074 length:207 start_codon:yes stop_codon:yes gene_type:complete
MSKELNENETRPRIYERNPDTGVIRWRYVGEDPESYGWPHYGNILSEEEAKNLEGPLSAKDSLAKRDS